MKLVAPFTDSEVKNLNDWQESGLVHPFTCPNRSDGRHDYDILHAWPDGWRCNFCDYTQAWAHDFMLNGDGLKKMRDQIQKINVKKVQR